MAIYGQVQLNLLSTRIDALEHLTFFAMKASNDVQHVNKKGSISVQLDVVDEEDVEVHPTQFFITLDPNEHPDTIEHLKELLNAEEIWFRSEINLRLWEVDSFPYTDPASGNLVTDIQGQVVVAKSKTKINDAGFNVVDTGMSEAPNGNEVCFDQIDFTLPQGQTEVKISILDTGIGDLSNYNDPNYSFELTTYEGYDYIHNDADPDDEHGHGTAIAGLIYHITETAEGANQVTFDIRKTHDADGRGLVSHIIPAILDAVNEGAQIINMSFNYMDYRVDTLLKPLQLAIAYGESQGVLFVAASGNNGFNNDQHDIISFPASFPNEGILTIASSKCNMDLSSFSNYGTNTVDVAVLGEHIPVPNIDFGTYNAHGTSFSCAIVSAMAASLASTQQSFNAAMLKEVFLSSTIYNSNLIDKVLTEGFVDYENTYTFNGEPCEPSNAPEIVSSIADTGNGTLREAIHNACDGDTILFLSTVNDTIELTSQLLIVKDLVIMANPGNQVVVSGQHLTRIFKIQPTSELTILNLSLHGGNAEVDGGALLNEGILILGDAEFVDNRQGNTSKVWTNKNEIKIMPGSTYLRID